MLKLVGAKLFTEEDDEYLGYLNLENGKFAYVLKNGFNSTDVALFTLSFEAILAGESFVSISNIIESYGEAFEILNDKAELSITVLEDATGGDVEDDTTDDVTPEEEPKDDTIVEELPKEEEKNEVVVRPVVKSSDYYIKNLVIDGYEIDFDMYNYEYTVKVENDVTSLDFNVVLNNSKSIYWLEGNENFKSGENLVYLVVKAENGSTKTYTIKVVKDKDKVVKENDTDLEELDEEVEEENNKSKTVIIILIILVIIGLIYVIFKDDEEDNKKEVKKTSQPEKVKSEEVKITEIKKETPKNTKNNTSKNTNNNKKKNSKKK
jgi:hypothetical protein